MPNLRRSPLTSRPAVPLAEGVPRPYTDRMKDGLFLCLEGVDGVGKSTQLDLLTAWLAELGHDVLRCREPGGTPVGERLRELLLDPRTTAGPVAETMLYMASRAELVATVLRPALAARRTIVCDRYLTSTVVYQGHAGGLPVEDVRCVGRIATGGLRPDWTGILDLPIAAARGRRSGRGSADRIERRPEDYHERVRRGYLAEAAADERLHVIDASGDAAAIHHAVRAEVRRVCPQIDR